jgi:hypothetical protein
MKTYNSDSEQYGTFFTGLAYSGILAIILLLFCLVINDNLFEYSLTYISIIMACSIFFFSGLKKVEEKKLGFLIKLGKRHFEEYYSEGLWWIFPLWTFRQKPHFNILNEADQVDVKIITSDDILLDIHVKYYWQLKDPENIDNKFNPSFIKNTLEYELGKFVRTRNAIELLSSEDVSSKILVTYLEKAGEKIGIAISDVFPNINYENNYIPVVREYKRKYKELQYQLDSLLKIKVADMKIYESQIKDCISNLGFTSQEAMQFIKVYKNKVNMNEYTFNIGELNKVIESVLTFYRNI